MPIRRILLYDNHDSFTWNLEHLLVSSTGAQVTVLPCEDVARLPRTSCGIREQADLFVISPGPGAPEEYAVYGPLLESGAPVLGICLGMQIINAHFGGRTERLPGCVHGKAEEIDFSGRRVVVARYHSLCVTKPGRGLTVTARNGDGVPMALRHESRPLMGYQFHPESFLTQDGGGFIHHALKLLDLA